MMFPGSTHRVPWGPSVGRNVRRASLNPAGPFHHTVLNPAWFPYVLWFTIARSTHPSSLKSAATAPHAECVHSRLRRLTE